MSDANAARIESRADAHCSGSALHSRSTLPSPQALPGASRHSIVEGEPEPRQNRRAWLWRSPSSPASPRPRRGAYMPIPGARLHRAVDRRRSHRAHLAGWCPTRSREPRRLLSALPLDQELARGEGGGSNLWRLAAMTGAPVLCTPPRVSWGSKVIRRGKNGTDGSPADDQQG
jgi:hypothetical protein